MNDAKQVLLLPGDVYRFTSTDGVDDLVVVVLDRHELDAATVERMKDCKIWYATTKSDFDLDVVNDKALDFVRCFVLQDTQLVSQLGSLEVIPAKNFVFGYETAFDGVAPKLIARGFHGW